MEGFQKITSKSSRKFPMRGTSPAVTYYVASGKLYFNASATKAYDLLNFKYVDLYLGESKILVCPTNTRSDGSLKFTKSPVGLTIHVKGVEKANKLDLSNIYNTDLEKDINGLVFQIDKPAKVVKPRKFGVTGRLILPLEISYRGSAEWAKDKLIEVARGIVDDVESSDVVLDTLTELQA